jgi:hypothetical protein
MRKSQIPIVELLLACLLLSGCFSLEPTYTKEKIVESITALCQQEYQIKPKVWLLGETVWIYMGLSKLITKDVQFDQENLEKINKVIIGASRVLLSMKPRPQFMVVVASDTAEYGLDYTIITWIPDIVKYQLQFISRDEFSRRNVIKIKESPQALFDSQGSHIEKRDIKVRDFLAEQIAQRIQLKFNLDLNLKDCFKLESINTVFDKDIFRVIANIKLIKVSPKTTMDTQGEIAKIVAYVFKEYDFKDFLLVEIENTATGEKSELSQMSLKDFLK